MREKKCGHCPLIDAGRQCPGQIAERVCHRADRDSLIYDPKLAAELLAPRLGNPTPAEVMAKLTRVRECPHWSRPSCSCEWGVCALGKGRNGDVSTQDCLGCLDGPGG